MAELEAALAAVTLERDTLRLAYRNAQQELELLRRRLFVAKAERLDTTQLELEFAHKLAALDALNQQLGSPVTAETSAAADDDDARSRPRRGKPKPTGRRDLRDLDLPEERIELLDPALEGVVPRIGWVDSCQLSWRRACYVRTVIARAKYREGGADDSTLATAPLPPQILPRALATSSLLAHVVSEKFCDGMPFHRQEDRTARLGLRIDRGTMCRWAEDLGGIVGSSVVQAMRDEAMRTAFCISTDATGVLLQPLRGGDQPRRGCRRGHFLVQIADADHVFFEYLPRETSTAIGALFRGFSGYGRRTKSVYDLCSRRLPSAAARRQGADLRRAASRVLGAPPQAVGETAITSRSGRARGRPPRADLRPRPLLARQPPAGSIAARAPPPPAHRRLLQCFAVDTSGSRASAACCARPSATPIASAAPSLASSTTVDSS